jgi:hypothetical protein
VAAEFAPSLVLYTAIMSSCAAFSRTDSVCMMLSVHALCELSISKYERRWAMAAMHIHHAASASRQRLAALSCLRIWSWTATKNRIALGNKKAGKGKKNA